MSEHLEVWAPDAHRVEAVFDGGHRAALSEHGDGWFTGPALAADYRFALDGGPALPDPRSRSQPDGPHGASRVVDLGALRYAHGDFRPGPWAEQVVYELHVGTFTDEGTFDAAIARLPHLVALGVTAVEVMPVAEFPGNRGWGYDGVDLYAVHHAYGGPHGFAAFVDECHGHGLAVILDVVYNHLGPDGNNLGAFGPYFTDRYSTPWGAAINFDGPGSDTVRKFFIDNALQWLRAYQCDGLRLDAVHAIVDTSAVHILEAIADAAAPLGKWIIAESDQNDPRLVRERELGGYGLTAQWSDDFHHALHVALTGERAGYYSDFNGLPDLAAALERVFVYDGRYSQHRGRTHGRGAAGLPASRFLGYAQNHDQVGNRAAGERLSQLVSTGRLYVAAAVVLTAPFVPMLFQGEEWGASTPFQYFTDHQDPALAQAVSEGRRNEFASFGWSPVDVPDPQDPATFARSRLRWDEVDRAPHRDLLAWHKTLIALRPALRDAPVACDVDLDAGVLTVERGEHAVVANLGAETVKPPVVGGDVVAASPGAGSDALASDSVLIVRNPLRS